MLQLTSKQIAELKAYLGNYGLDVKRAAKPRKPKETLTVQQVLAKSKWYKPPSLSTRGISTTARYLSVHQWEDMRENPAKHGLCFPYREI